LQDTGAKVLYMIRVYLLEDDPLVAQINAHMVESIAGFEVVGAARTVRQAKKEILELYPDLLLLDVYLPDGSGLELLHELRGLRHSVVAMMITAANDRDSVQKALSDGVVDYLVKPFERPRLEAALERFVLHKKIQAESRLTQDSIDQLLGHKLEPELPKGIDPHKLEQVKTTLRSAAHLSSAEEVAAALGISRVTAWRYLEHLCATGWARLETEQAGAGRPTKRYRRLG
jgi:response regulator of citrate/malate metabolism